MSIWVTGDIHSDPSRLLYKETFRELNNLTKDDYVIILGDFGLIWDQDENDKYEQHWLTKLNDAPFTTLFIDGNHENFDRLDGYPIMQWNGGNAHFIRPSIIHLMRGQVFNIVGKTFFTFGGASSHDIQDGILEMGDPDFLEKYTSLIKDPYSKFRINHRSWWKRELPNEEEMKCGIQNLKKVGNNVDYIITHSPCTTHLILMDGGAKLYKKDILTDYLQRVKETVNYKRWFFGHMHINYDLPYERAICLYENIMRIQ